MLPNDSMTGFYYLICNTVISVKPFLQSFFSFTSIALTAAQCYVFLLLIFFIIIDMFPFSHIIGGILTTVS